MADDFGLTRFTAAASIVACCGIFAITILAKLHARVEFERNDSEIKHVSLDCPSCSKRLTLDLGKSTCPHCHLRLLVRVQTPRCSMCEYDLSHIASQVCPECGTPGLDLAEA